MTVWLAVQYPDCQSTDVSKHGSSAEGKKRYSCNNSECLRRTFILFRKTRNWTAQLVAQHPNLAIAVDLADEFLQLLRQQRADAFEAWLIQALKSSLKPFQTFAEGLFNDYAAVQASMMSNVSNGPVEGLNNRLKMLKRQMDGRAGLELLSKRFILAQ